ncbi:UDP-N-acetylmuramoyl-L-alanine--D-glutamate ligase [Nicoliella lavandulae]|uniref:UDP-N-acetylmuramoylalanine--D-glutamate ligase n=1 Tax=Nicoliella lavandulae TaxID=3082954 RepID=A0ABU8SLP5_9LACO
MKNISNYQGKNVLILGAGKSGINAANLLIQLGAKVTMNDAQDKGKLTGLTALSPKVKLITGGHPDDLLDADFDLMVKNPGINYDNVVVKKAMALKMPIITEVELASEINEGQLICVTGSNGKTTTTTMITEMLNQNRKSGHAYAVGNIGVSASKVAEQAHVDDTIVMEISSFMLLGITELHPHIAVLTNIFANHLDYHKTRENYVNAKMRITMNQTADDYFVVNFDSDELQELSNRSKAKIVPFSRLAKSKAGAYELNGKLYFKSDYIMDAEEVRIPGDQNVENALAAIAVAKIMGKDNESIRHVLMTFGGVRHRLQYVLTADGRKYYNDSKATDIEATQVALRGFHRPIVLLAGGLDRGYHFDKLIPDLKEHVKGIVLFGEAKHLLADAAQKAGIKSIEIVDNLDQAVPAAYHMSERGDIILLSPANASWDQFKTFEERGERFIHDVEKLTGKQEEK